SRPDRAPSSSHAGVMMASSDTAGAKSGPMESAVVLEGCRLAPETSARPPHTHARFVVQWAWPWREVGPASPVRRIHRLFYPSPDSARRVLLREALARRKGKGYEPLRHRARSSTMTSTCERDAGRGSGHGQQRQPNVGP